MLASIISKSSSSLDVLQENQYAKERKSLFLGGVHGDISSVLRLQQGKVSFWEVYMEILVQYLGYNKKKV